MVFTKKKLLLFLLPFVLLFVGALLLAYAWFAPQFHPARTVYVYVDNDDTPDSVRHKLHEAAPLNALADAGLRLMAHLRGANEQVRTGRYAVRPNENVYHVLSRFIRGYQEPMNLVVPGVRTLDLLARSVGRQLLTDSADIARILTDSARIAALGYDTQTLPALFVPNTYEVWWNMSPDNFLTRMVHEHERFWTRTRRDQARTLGLTPIEVATLASIVEEETNAPDERPIVAGLYLNRLRRGIPLQADPTIRFALRDFARQRVTHADLSIDSPYNTYAHPGLPPGPIRIATPQAIDAVLNATHHNYLYMCAKEDFSGRHNFASNYADHLRNARRYQQELNKRKIFH